MSEKQTDTKAANKIGTPVVLSDKIVDQVNVIREQAQRIGQLEGEKEVYKNNFMVAKLQFEEKMETAAKEVTIKINDRTSDTGYVVTRTTRSASAYSNPYEEVVNMLTEGSKNVSVTTKNVDDLTGLADAIVKGDAEKATADAEKKVEKAEKSVKTTNDLLDATNKAQKAEVERSIERAEKINLRTIASLRDQLKTKDVQLDIDRTEHEAIKYELELAVEALDHKNTLLDKMVNTMRMSSNTLLEKVIWRMKWRGSKLSKSC